MSLESALGAGGFETISHHTDRGRGFASVATEVGVYEPKAILLAVRIRPDRRVRVNYIYDCRSGEGERESRQRTTRTRSSEIDLPLLVDRPRDCLVYAEADYDKPHSERTIKLSMRLLAKSRD